MNIDWLDELEKKEPDEKRKKAIELQNKYKEMFGSLGDVMTWDLDDDEIIERFETCIKTKTRWRKLYPETISKNIEY